MKRVSKPVHIQSKEMIMLHRLKPLVEAIRKSFSSAAPSLARFTAAVRTHTSRGFSRVCSAKCGIVAVGIVGGLGYALYKEPPMRTVSRSEIGIRINDLTGSVSEFKAANVLVIPGIHHMRVYSLRDQSYRPEKITRADGPAPLQSVEGLSVGVDLSIRYALDPAQIAATSKNLPDALGTELVDP